MLYRRWPGAQTTILFYYQPHIYKDVSFDLLDLVRSGRKDLLLRAALLISRAEALAGFTVQLKLSGAKASAFAFACIS